MRSIVILCDDFFRENPREDCVQMGCQKPNIETLWVYEREKLETPTVIEGENYIKCILPRQKQITIDTPQNDTEKLKQLFKIHYEITTADVVKNLSISRSTALRRLNELVELGFIERLGMKKSVRYRRKR